MNTKQAAVLFVLLFLTNALVLLALIPALYHGGGLTSPGRLDLEQALSGALASAGVLVGLIAAVGNLLRRNRQPVGTAPSPGPLTPTGGRS